MLPRENRMRRSSEFASVVRSGERARRGHVVVHRHSSLHTGKPVVGLVVVKSAAGCGRNSHRDSTAWPTAVASWCVPCLGPPKPRPPNSVLTWTQR
jgi:hypothetical protein